MCGLSKKIKVYNAYFGDCIVLEDTNDGSNLLVDFGIHYFSDVPYIYGKRDGLTHAIADNIINCYSDGNTSLLITHFHEDHIISEIIQSLGLIESNFEDELVLLAENLCNFVIQILLDYNRRYSESNENLYISQTIHGMRQTYNDLLFNLEKNILDFEKYDLLNVQKEKLNKLNHKYNIVFQNNIFGNENVLFTGDIEVKQMILFYIININILKFLIMERKHIILIFQSISLSML